ncbi:MAG TPA: sporulation protein YabP [Firmicutes bacterium]|nr:sporulation protein YabP [Bacillota bacterium]
MEDKKKPVTIQHRVEISERESITVSGVSNVESFDDQEVVLETSAGVLLIRGRELHVKQLNLDEGNLAIEGFIQGLDYLDEGGGKKARGLLGRLLK